MRIQLISIGTKMPRWVDEACKDYAKRLPPHFQFKLVELPAKSRGKTSAIAQIIQQEGDAILAQIPHDQHCVALDNGGKLWSTKQLAEQLRHWQTLGQNISLFIGGPDGLSTACRQRANQTWSLSPLTFPHPLARVIVVEQLYRAWSILNGHPYHRA